MVGSSTVTATVMKMEEVVVVKEKTVASHLSTTASQAIENISD